MSKKSPGNLAFPPLVLGKSAKAGVTAESQAAGDMTDGVEALLEPAVEPVSDPAPALAAEPLADATPAQPQIDARALDHAVFEPPVDFQPLAAFDAPPRKPKATKAKRIKASQRVDLEALPPTPVADIPTSPQASRLPLWARLAYPGAFTLAALWSAPLVAFCLAYQNHYGPFEYAPFPPVVFGALALLPAAFMLLGAYVLRQAAKLSMETRRARAIAEELAIPAALAADQAGGAADAVRREVSRATQAGEAAERQLQALRQSLADESDRLIAVTENAERTARALTESLSRERTGMAALSSSLELQVEAMNEAIGRQTQLVADTSDLASAQLHEAQAGLSARATDLAAAVGEAGEIAELAGEALSRQAERLETVGDLVGERLQAVNEDLGRGHSRLADLAVRLQADQQALADRLEAQRLSALATAAEAQDSVLAITGGAEQVAATLRDLIAEADERLRSVGAAVQGEQAALDARARASLALFRDAVADERAAIEADSRSAIDGFAASAEEIRRTAAVSLAAAETAAAAQAQAARAQVEELGEAAFAAGQKADQAFDARIAAARRSIEQSAALVEQAGQQSVGRVDAGIAALRTALGEFDALLAGVDARIAAVPAETRAQAEAVRAAVDASLAEIAASARKVTADTEAVDAALQERVKRNYEMLSEALKTMGKVAAVTEQAAARAAAGQMAPSTPAAASFAERAIRVPPTTTLISTASPSPAIAAAEPPPLRPAALAAGDAGLRPRLRLTPEHEIAAPRPAAPIPAAVQAPVQTSLQAARPDRPPPVTHETLDPFLRAAAPPLRAAPRAEPPRDTTAWTWKDLLSSIDEPPIDDEVLAERLISEIEALGLDAATLLPLAQIDAIAIAMQKGDAEAVREAVRALAPGAVRRLSRRVLTDKVLRAQADRYVRRYEDLLNDSARRDHEGFMTAALLGSEPGRAFLLFDAAVGELH